jgi:hypothetical protein
MVSMVIRQLLHLLLINRLSDDSPHIYVVRKVTGYAVNALAALVITGIWLEHLGNLSVALGILGAGLAFALQEVIGSIAGWVTILTGRPFTIGDRIETGGIRGDVVDISVLRTTLMEIGNWLGGDHNTGRIVTVSNAFIFKEPLFNYSRHLRYIWDEIKLPITYESDWQRALAIMTDAVQQNTMYQELLPIAIAAVAGVVLMILTRCLTMEEAYRSIEWKAVFLIAGMLPLGIAMEQTGAARFLAEGMVGLVGGLGPLAVMAGLFLLAALASQVMPNPAVAVLLAPIAFNTATDLGISPYLLMMAVAVSASAAFLSPVGHSANILVMGPGGYRFADYTKVGIPLTLVVLVVVLFVLPIFWPF